MSFRPVLRQMIEGNAVFEYLDGVWACELLPDPPPLQKMVHSIHQASILIGPLTQIGQTIDNTTKTRAVFEINKGINKLENVNVNARMSADEKASSVQ